MNKLSCVILSTALCASLANAEQFKNNFEPEKDRSAFSGKPEISFGADLTFTYQGLSQEGGKIVDYSGSHDMKDLQAGLVLPTANLDVNGKVMSGFNVKLETMLSSHHHNETYVKGGYATIDNLDFIAPGFLSAFMDNATIKVGVDDINFGDDHFRRTDNAKVMANPFVHNLAVEAYMQAPHIEIFYRLPANMFALVGITNGQLDPDDVDESHANGSSNRPGGYGKFGYDAQLSDTLRLRISESIYYVKGTNKSNTMFLGDKAGTVSRSIFDYSGSNEQYNDFGSNWNAMSGYSDLTLSHTNLFVRYVDTEFYAMYEYGDGSNASNKDMTLDHYAFDVVQRFYNDKAYVAARYEKVKVDNPVFNFNGQDAELTQWQLAVGYYFSKNAVAKLEYIDQEREHNSMFSTGSGEFKGYMISTALHF